MIDREKFDFDDSDDDYPARIPPHWNRHRYVHHLSWWEVALGMFCLGVIAAACAWKWL